MRIHDSLSLLASMQFGLGGPRDGHVYAVAGPEGGVLVDSGAGTDTGRILQVLAEDLPGLAVRALLLTHYHLDHCGGAAELREATGCEVFGPEPCRFILEQADEAASGLKAARDQGVYPADFRLRACEVTRPIRDGETFTAAGRQFTAIHVRGHCREASCYLTRMDGAAWLFTGDAVFYGGVLGVINAEGSGMDGYRADLHKLGGLGVDGLFPGHGLFTLRNGQRHIDCAITQAAGGFLGRQVGQGDLLF
ncbi:MAG: MBL fold metallo-hydrolase [Luteitalea sp.]|nr:MBL fold metallo-hydrolase [Luteitalea sp.]